MITVVDKLTKTRPELASKLADRWISKYVVKSHIYYDEVIKMLKIMKKAKDIQHLIRIKLTNILRE